jgi:predicted ArsR family transcriptional regulator
LNKREAKDMVETFFDEIRDALERGESVKLSGFGNFQLRDKPQRPGRNPKTGEDSALVRGRGRPSKVFIMTDQGREKFEHSYDDLAVAALKFISAQSGEHLVTAFAQSRADEIGRKASLALAQAKDKTEALAEFLTEQGYATTVTTRGQGEEICQHHCPIAHVAAEFPQLCEAETELFSQLLGTHVQRLATIAHGDGVCTTFIPKNKKQLSSGKARS